MKLKEKQCLIFSPRNDILIFMQDLNNKTLNSSYLIMFSENLILIPFYKIVIYQKFKKARDKVRRLYIGHIVLSFFITFVETESVCLQLFSFSFLTFIVQTFLITTETLEKKDHPTFL